jgi:nitroreductase
LDAYEAVRTKLDVREFGPDKVPFEIKRTVLEAGRLTQSAMNSQHWRFILVQEPGSLALLAQDSTTGSWISNADFAVVVCTPDPPKSYHLIDAGRAIQDMQLAAWGSGVASGIYTGVKQAELRRDFGVPDSLAATAVVGFGYPKRRLAGRKDRKPISEVAYMERYGRSWGSADVGQSDRQ